MRSVFRCELKLWQSFVQFLNYKNRFIDNPFKRTSTPYYSLIKKTNKKEMDDDMRKSLLNKKSATFDKQYQECLIKIQRIKQKNDFMQKQVGTDVQEAVRKEVTNQRKFIEKEIKQLKAIMDDMDRKFKDPESKNKLKSLKIDAQKQVERNKIIMKDFINKSFMKISQGSMHSQDDPSQYIEGGNINYVQLNPKDKENHETPRRIQVIAQAQEPEDQAGRDYHNESLLTDQNLDMDFEIERKILQEKKQLLDEVEQTTLRVNEIMSDMAVMVNEQGEDLQTISQQMMTTNKNLVDTNKEMDEASRLQKKSRRKYCIFAVLLIFLVAGAVGVIFIAKG